MKTHAEKAVELFGTGLSCSQAVFAAFAPDFGMDEKTALKVSAALGGGVGRLREVCGTVTGAGLVIGLRYGNESGEDRDAKKKTYEVMQAFAAKFREANGSIVCRELLGLAEIKPVPGATPTARTPEFYRKRPCVELVRFAAELLEEFL